jgi:hypothetical protein
MEASELQTIPTGLFDGSPELPVIMLTPVTHEDIARRNSSTGTPESTDIRLV